MHATISRRRAAIRPTLPVLLHVLSVPAIGSRNGAADPGPERRVVVRSQHELPRRDHALPMARASALRDGAKR